MSNEIAFVALAQSHGRASEAAAVLHLPRAKDEASLVAMMLDVSSFIALTREVAERRRRSRKLEEQHRQEINRNTQRPIHPPTQKKRRKKIPSSRHEMSTSDGISGSVGGGGNDGNSGGSGCSDGNQKKTSAEQGSGVVDYREQAHCRGEPTEIYSGSRSRGSGSPPALLPPLVGLTKGTPPTPRTLKTVLSTSPSVALGIPEGFGLKPDVEEEAKQTDIRDGSISSQR